MKHLAKLRNFSGRTTTDLKSLLDNAAAELARSPLSGTVSLAVIGGARRRMVRANLDRPQVEEASEGEEATSEAPDFMVYVEKDALEEILRGELSPLAAFLRGRLRYTGDQTLGVAIYRALAVTQDAVFEPCLQPRRR